MLQEMYQGSQPRMGEGEPNYFPLWPLHAELHCSPTGRPGSALLQELSPSLGVEAVTTQIHFTIGVEMNLDRELNTFQVFLVRELTCKVFGEVICAVGGLTDKYTKPIPRVSPEDVILTMRAKVRAT